MPSGKSKTPIGTVALAASWIAGAGAAFAASTPDNSPPVDSVPEKTAPNTAPAANLSQKLDQSNGVIQPKDTDPEMQKPAPATGTGDVLTPPGTPGGPAAPTPK